MIKNNSNISETPSKLKWKKVGKFNKRYLSENRDIHSPKQHLYYCSAFILESIQDWIQ